MSVALVTRFALGPKIAAMIAALGSDQLPGGCPERAANVGKLLSFRRAAINLRGLLLSAHVFFGNCIGRGPHYKVEATEHGTNLFVVKVGDSSKARKGTGEDRVLSFFRHVDDEWTGRRVHTGLSSGEGVIWEVRDPIIKLAKDRKSGATVEEVIDQGG